ncbi:juvenile hormone binding protein 16 [Lycorma delicatula]|uniref:juvenile hormone binding protein 16 n=1 Tax=Lycorma delicatula TaxID=130591 RepID=UPI003F50FD6F
MFFQESYLTLSEKYIKMCTSFATVLITLMLTSIYNCQEQDLSVSNFVNHFSHCSISSNNFDNCMKKALNEVRPWFKKGVPELNIPPFDPFFAKEVIQKRGGTSLNYKLKLTNVYERGWTMSEISKFKFNPQSNSVKYTQFFPEKYLEGGYEIEAHVPTMMTNKGVWNLTLYNYMQTTTISRPKNSNNLKVNIEVNKIGNMDLHISNLLRGRNILEGIMDRVINATWRPGFAVIKPLINDIVSTAFTEIFNKAFNGLSILNLVSP